MPTGTNPPSAFAASVKTYYVKPDSADKSDTVSFAKNAVSKELGENRAGAGARLRRCFATFPPNRRRDSAAHLKQLVKKVGAEKATAMLEKAEEGFKENYALLKKLSEM